MSIATLVTAVVVLVILGLVVYLVETYIPMSPPFKVVLRVVVVLLLVLWLLSVFGLWDPGVIRTRCMLVALQRLFGFCRHRTMYLEHRVLHGVSVMHYVCECGHAVPVIERTAEELAQMTQLAAPVRPGRVPDPRRPVVVVE